MASTPPETEPTFHVQDVLPEAQLAAFVPPELFP
jgi:hypothetical protein